MPFAITLSLLIWATSTSMSAGDSYVIAGSAGCDSQDTLCRKPTLPTDMNVLWSYIMSPGGKLYPQKKWTVGGIPAWIVTRTVAEVPGVEYTDCMFITLPDVNEVISFKNAASGFQPAGLAVLSGGQAPVHAEVSPNGKVLVVANYHGPDETCVSVGASVAAFNISADCTLTASDVKPHEGSSVGKRQCAAHVHGIAMGADGMVFVADLGQDIIFTYHLGSDGKMTELARTHLLPGSGPRHMVRHPTKNFLYVVTEMTSTLLAYEILPSGSLEQIMNTSTEPKEQLTMGYGSKAAEILISADGSTIYASNRAFLGGFSSAIAVFGTQNDGGFHLLQEFMADYWVRGMALSAGGDKLVVEGQRQGVLQTFHVNSSGLLSKTGFEAVEGPAGAASLVVMSARHIDTEHVV